MIRPIDIRLNAAHPDLPLAEAVTYTGAPSTVLIRGVPGNCGRWAITAVFVAATFPDGSTSTRTAVQSANGVWVATLPATATSGRTAHGLRILADGADENGEAVGGYVLGVADFAVASLAVTPAPEPGETSWQMLYFDAVPGVLRKGDVTKIDGVLKLYNGTAWEPFAIVPAPSTANPAMDGTAAPGTSASYARGDHVHPTDTSRVPTSRTVNGKALTGDVTLTANDIDYSVPGGAQSVQLALEGIEAALVGKQNALTTQQLANIAAVSDALAFDATHSYAAGDPVVYNGTLYTFTSAHTGAWTGSDVSAVNIIARLAGKADNNSVVHKTGNETVAGTKLFSGWRAYSEVATPQHFIGFSTSDVSSAPFAILFQNGDANSQYRYALPLKSGVMTLLSDLADYAPLNSPAFTGTPIAPTPTAGDNSTKVSTTAFVQGAVPYTLPAESTAIISASSEVIGGETVYYGEATLADRTQNQVAVLVALDELRVTIPPAVSGKVRDFGLVVAVGLGEGTALAAPALVPVAPSGETIKMVNAEGEMPTLADGTTTSFGLTVIYFTELGNGTFLVKGEQVEEVA